MHLQRFELHGRVVCRVGVDQPILLGGVVLHLGDPEPFCKEPSGSFPLLGDADLHLLPDDDDDDEDDDDDDDDGDDDDDDDDGDDDDQQLPICQ